MRFALDLVCSMIRDGVRVEVRVGLASPLITVVTEPLSLHTIGDPHANPKIPSFQTTLFVVLQLSAASGQQSAASGQRSATTPAFCS